MFVETSAGPIEVIEHGSRGRPVVFVGGLAMNASVWRHVIGRLPDLRCVTVTLPLGGHSRPMRADADLSLYGLAGILGEVFAEIDLREGVLVGNDSGAYLAAAVAEQECLAGLVVTSCEAFDHFPPGLPGRMAAAAARVPGGIDLIAQSLRVRPLRGTPTVLGWMSKRGVPHAITDDWVAPLIRDAGVRRDLRRYLLSATRAEMVRATDALSGFGRPALVVWTPEDKVMDPAHGARIAALLPDAHYREITDSYTLIPEDQPLFLADAIREFVDAL